MVKQDAIWDSYDSSKRDQYTRLIKALGALSPVFRQKDEGKENNTAFISSKYQEAAFAKSFNGRVVDKGNDPYDVMIPSSTPGKKDLIGIKTFLNSSSPMQKIMQFKSVANNENWSGWISNGEYEKLINRIAELRNQKLYSAQHELAGPMVSVEEVFGNIFYHYLSPTRDGRVLVGEASYDKMNESKLFLLDVPKNQNGKVTSIKFSDGTHEFKYTPADSTLYMSFKHTETLENGGDIVDSFNVDFFDDPYSALLRMYDFEFDLSYIDNKTPTSGIEKFPTAESEPVEEDYEYYVFPLFRLDRRGDTEAGEIDSKSGLNVRLGAPKNKNSDTKRPENEVEIKIPESKKFHEMHPDFFGFASDGSPKTIMDGSKPVHKKEDRVFTLVLMKSEYAMDAYTTGDSLKQIMSYSHQTELGKWILSQIFALKPYELLTRQKIDELGIDGIKLIKLGESKIGMDFVKIKEEDMSHLWPERPEDFRALASGLDDDA